MADVLTAAHELFGKEIAAHVMHVYTFPPSQTLLLATNRGTVRISPEPAQMPTGRFLVFVCVFSRAPTHELQDGLDDALNLARLTLLPN